ncbi:MAG: hypothetical protein H6Q32_839 [Bacteroidetes bacterium]|nr:hypothetical protein [Bacteroidota bacterium]MBP1691487.1 hypothetical protein [Bacteroidota bacterium]
MHRSLLLLAVLLPGVCQVAVAQVGAPTNIRVYQHLSTRIGDSVSAHIPERDSLRILLSVVPEGSAWLIEGGIAQAFRERGYTVVVAPPAEYEAELGVLEMRVVYGEVRSDGLFSGNVVDREVHLSASAKLVDRRSSVLTVSREFRQTSVDTVLVSEIPQLEDPNIPITQGAPPGEGFFSSLAEPLILLGAVAVAVYLLFTVRS